MRVTTTTTARTDSLQTVRENDVAGRVTREVDETGKETLYEYTWEDGVRQTIVRYPGNQDKVIQYYLDGQVRSITGSTVVPQFHTYGVEAVDGGFCRYSEVRTGSADSLRRVRTWYDMVGRAFRTERPISVSDNLVATNLYDTDGRLSCTVTTDGDGVALAGVPDQCYGYDGLGNVTRSGLDVSDNGQLDPASSDRFTETEAQYELSGNDWWHVTRTFGYPFDGQGTQVLVSTSRRQATGLSASLTARTESIDVYGNVTTSVTSIDRSTKTEYQVTTVPGSEVDARTVTCRGLLASTTTPTGLTFAYEYDGLGRRTVTTYDPVTGQVTEVSDADGHTTTYAYYGSGEANAGRLELTTNAAGKKTYYDYNERGQALRIWGDVPQPVEFGYNVLGERTSQTTFRDGSGWANPYWPGGISDDVTLWDYDPCTGLLASKTYADSSHVDYRYTRDGRLRERTWARGETTTYYYFGEGPNELNTGELRLVDYSDPAMQDIAYGQRDRLGRITTVTDAAGVRTMTYDGVTLQLVSEAIAGTGGLINRTITRDYSPANDPVVRRRPIGLQVGTDGYVTTWHYDEYGRLNRVQGPGLPAYGAVYVYQANSDLVAVTGFLSDAQTTLGTATRTFEGHRDVVAEVTNVWGATPKSTYHYEYDSLARRTSVVNMGTAFSQPRWTKWVYNARNELTESRRFNGLTVGNESSPVPTQQFVFDYDPIGNRESYSGDAVEGAMSYTTNPLNQYRTTTTPDESFTYDADGNLTATGKHAYTYDGENRLIVVVPIGGIQSPGDRKVTFTYDYLGRRVRKQAFPRSGNGWSTTPTLDRRFVYDGWNLLEELNGLSSNAVLFKYTWGLDLSGQNGNNSGSVGVSPAGLHSAGGIGGLLAMLDTKGTPSPSDDRKFVYFYDANGNVGQLIECTSGLNFGTTQARYEYYPFGGILVSTGTYAEINPFKFSTKYRDGETGLYYNNYRYLIPRLGRWVNRDPLQELGGVNLYTAVRNNPINRFDPFGLDPQEDCVSKCVDELLTNPSMSPQDCVERCASQSPPKPAGVPAGSDCGIEIHQSPFCLIGGAEGGQLGHTWLTWGGGGVGEAADCPSWEEGGRRITYINSAKAVCQKNYVNNKWHVTKDDTGSFTLNGESHSCKDASCADIKSCLHEKTQSCGEFNKETNNCRQFVEGAMAGCCLRKAGLFYVDPGMPFKYCCSDCAKHQTSGLD